jgi:putative ABC transport system substrate-binding protein
MRVRVPALELALALAFLAVPAAADAQPAGPGGPRKVHRIGFISNSTPTAGTVLVDAFRQGLVDLGWVERQNLHIEYRWAEGDFERYPRLAAELVALRVDVMVLAGTGAARAAVRATRTIPVVAAVIGDPVAGGLVRSLAKPGGNLTGLAWQARDLVTKQLQLLQETVPRATRVAALGHAAIPGVRQSVEAAARSLGVQVHMTDIEAITEIPGVFETMERRGAEALIVLPSPMFYAERRQLATLAARHRLPAIYEVKEFVGEGGLMSYGPSFPEMYRRAATYVDKILKGAKPGDLPMEQPTKFEFVINLKTAKALGLAIPPPVLARADELIR